MQTGRLPRLPGNAFVWAGLGIFCAVNLFLLVRSYNGSIGSDYLFTYSAVVGAHLDGFNHLYDPISQQRGLPQGYVQADWAFRYPPIIAILAWPLGSLPFWPGYFIWFAVELGGWIIAWRLLAPEPRSSRWRWLLALFATYTVIFGLRMGQEDGYVAACIAATWALSKGGRPYVAGFVLALASMKPLLTWLVPFALLLAGERRVLLGWVASLAVWFGISVELLGPDGIGRAAVALHGDIVARTGPFSIPTLVDHMPIGWVLDLVFVAVAIVLIRRHPSREIAFALGLLLSELTATYLLYQDIALVVLVAWFWLRAFPGDRDANLFAFALWVIAFLSLVASIVPVAEALWLLAAVAWGFRRPPAGRASAAGPAGVWHPRRGDG